MSKERIQEEALRLFALNGYAGTSVRMVVEAAGVTKPALYYHFGNKEGLYQSLLDHHLTGWLQMVRGIVEQDGPVRTRVHTYVQTAIAGAMQAPLSVRFVQRACSVSGDEAPLPSVDFHAEEARLLSLLVQQGVESGELRTANPLESAMALMAMTHWRVFASLHPDVPLTPQVAEHIADLWLKGVGA